MNRIIAGLMLAGAVAASQTPDAHADPGLTYIADLALAGVPTGTTAQEIYLGELICGNLSTGVPITETVTRLLPVAGMTPRIAVTIVSAAVMDLCPQYAPSAGTSSPAPTQPVPVTIASAIA